MPNETVYLGLSHSVCPRKPKCPQRDGSGEMLQMLSSIIRTVQRWRKKWLGLKVMIEKKIAAHKVDISATGGGDRVPLQCHLKVTEHKHWSVVKKSMKGTHLKTPNRWKMERNSMLFVTATKTRDHPLMESHQTLCQWVLRPQSLSSLHFEVSYMLVKFHNCILQNESGESKPKEWEKKHTQINLSALNMIRVAMRGWRMERRSFLEEMAGEV